MNKEAEKMLEKILEKDLSMLTSQDKGFLKARRDYLSKKQKATYAELLSEKEVDNTPKEPEEPEMGYQEMIARGKELGLEVKIGMKKDIILQMIKEAEEKLNQ